MTTKPTTESNEDGELQDRLAMIQATLGIDDIEWEAKFGDKQGLFGLVVELGRLQSLALLSRIKEEADDHYNGFGKVVTVEAIDNIAKEIRGE